MGVLDEGQSNLELTNGVKQSRFGTENVTVEDAVKAVLEGLGEDINREGLINTPLRVARAFLEGTRGYDQKVMDIVQSAVFQEPGLDSGHAGGVGGLVIVRDIDMFSYCESCLIPFQIKCHVGYVTSGQRILGLSKVSRVADVFAKRLQEPQRLANEVCSALHYGIKPAGVAIVLQCSHIHFPVLESAHVASSRGGYVKVSVSSGLGVFENRSSGVWSDFLSLLKFRGINVEKTYSKELWCPSRHFPDTKLSMAMAGPVSIIASIIKSFGEDPSRKGLVGTPARFLRWLMMFKKYNLEMNFGRAVFIVNGTEKCSVEQMQTELNLCFWSLCEHHLLPFHGVVHVGFLCAEGFKPVGKNVLESIVHFHGFKLQVQERLTRQIAESACVVVGKDVIVVVEARHSCMISRGIEKLESNTATIAALGQFSTDSNARSAFLQNITSTINL